MMSLSDMENTEFKPIDIGNLESFEDELSHKAEGTKPDLERFKMLFDPADLQEEGLPPFEALYSVDKEAKTDPFEPLIKGTAKAQGRSGESLPETADSQEDLEAIEPEISIEEQAFEQGYAKGFQQGVADGEEQGLAQGYDQGHAKGEPEGFEKGVAEGVAKGETDGFDKGFAEGREQAEAQVKAEATEILDPLKASLVVADQLLDRLVEKYEVQILALICKISEKAVMASVETKDEIVRHTILDALTSLVAPEEIILNVSSEDYEYIEMIKDDFFEAVGSLKRVAVKSDPLINKGGCKIETATATISTDPESKLLVIHDAIRNAVIRNAGIS
jgi:flagellar assembly protein FliH